MKNVVYSLIWRKTFLLSLFSVLYFAANSQAPVVSFTNSPALCSGQLVNFTDQSSNSPSTWSWSFPGATPSVSALQNPTVTFAAPGVYTVTHGASVPNFTGTPVTQTIYIAPSPTISFGATPQICAWESATLTASGASTYTWLPGPLSGSSIVVSAPSSTLFTVIGNTGACNTTSTTLLVVNPTFGPTTATILKCDNGNPIQITAAIPIANSYSWSTGATTPSVMVNPSTSQSYTCYAKANPNGCIINVFQINVVPNITVQVNPLNICAGSSSLMCATGATNYIWQPTSGLSSTVSGCPLAFPPVNTVYTVTGSNQACSASATVMVSVKPQPTLTISQATICAGESASICVNGANGYTWVATPGLNNYNVSCPLANPILTTNYYVSGAAANGCRNTASTTVNVNTCTGIRSIQNETINFELIPNPSSGRVLVKTTMQFQGYLEIYDINGQKVGNIAVKEALNTLDLKLSPGIYQVRLVNGANESRVKKIVIE